jgi:uncharacterized membrane protein
MNELPWGVLIILGIGLTFVAYIIYYILRLANEEMKNEEPINHSIGNKSSD